MKRILSKLIPIFIFLTGFSVMMYPTISNWLNTKNSSRVVSNYENALYEISEEDYLAEWQAATEYNQYLAKFGSISEAVLAERKDESGRYRELLDIGDTGVMGILQIPKINVKLPIYHTTDEAVLQVGIGHYEGSSLPTGGSDTHGVLTGHRGLPSAKLLTDLDQVELGDRFYISVLNEVLAYEINSIVVVLPDEVETISIRKGEDLITLVTCTPYGINSHRLLVTGHRVDYNGEMEVSGESHQQEGITNPAAADSKPLPPYVYMGFAVAVSGVLGITVRLVSNRRRKRKKMKAAEKNDD